MSRRGDEEEEEGGGDREAPFCVADVVRMLALMEVRTLRYLVFTCWRTLYKLRKYMLLRHQQVIPLTQIEEATGILSLMPLRGEEEMEGGGGREAPF